ncbi:MAG: LLM class flavin-dependent oxidoreductase [Rhodospirillaceae bacterium]|jgi:alkanesulfonate monooxygenase SsuD/methylene tetrahydromethanopterin reductase-like flavin-dependent oxidoreductase (luciferase family)|nr:LLM class flavin-dependent oxidoreductase [Rhodospirillaceae bacterium]MBT4042769.1 LLM class flavin-dependent oxidoreductase [Rhodospirillaceae bacterium]MBT4688758.1 LLM class flavin-dependent oxidoreductase [Rhodospirillaceae bacterium]MBT5083416.1 LLM class flavin-dependent oxidoreductase [Rhodospirillaceae bacterium]MBT5525534.1 LLM class flavin-dependent oxidoreductase [Rhodospirillaceae bacterium]
MKLGMFMMPLHDPARSLTDVLSEDREAVILADSLGMAEAWCGEHISSTAEPIASSLMFFASMIEQTKGINFASGVLNLPQQHPTQVAAQVANFDHMSRGRYIMGIGPGGLVSDFELLGLTDEKQRRAMMLESIDAIHKIWGTDAKAGPGYDIDGEYWPIKLKDAVLPHLGIGEICKPYQDPYPTVCLSIVSPHSSSATMAAERGWEIVSANFIQARYIQSHWQAYQKGCDNVGRAANPAAWRIARSILVTDDQQEAEDYIANPNGGLSFYFRYFMDLYRSRGILEMLKPDRDVSDDDLKLDDVIRSMVTFGDANSVLDQLVDLCEQWGDFGTLLMVGHDWDKAPIWRRSMTLLAEDVIPRLSQHLASRPATTTTAAE